MLTLVVVPPALGLPSVDADCLAAISYMNHAVPRGEWDIIADTKGIAAGCTGTWQGLPALWDGDLKISGYEWIVQHVRDISDGKWDLDDIKEVVGAERVSISGEICSVQRRVGPLLSHLLYTSPANYGHVLRPAFAQMLSFPESWIIPHDYHDAKVSQASRIVPITPAELSAAAAALTQIPPASTADATTPADPLTEAESLHQRSANEKKAPAYTSTSMVLDTHRKLRTLSADALRRFQRFAATGDSPYLYNRSTSKPTSLGCALFAYLALAIAAAEHGLPHPWLTSTLHAEYPELEAMVEKWMAEEWGFEFGASRECRKGALVDSSKVSGLPWRDSDTTIQDRTKAVVSGLLRQTGLDPRWTEVMPIREVERIEVRGMRYKSKDETRASGRGLGYQTDMPVGIAVGIATVVLGYKAWHEGF